MPFNIIEADITTLKVDAIVNAANPSLLGGGGVDGCIHRAAGPELLAECRKLNGCETGSAKLTRGYALKSKYLIHTVGPIWRGGNSNEAELLYSCYKSSLKLALEHGIESIAFPLISAGAYHFPRKRAIDIAVLAIKDFLKKNDMTVYLTIYQRRDFDIDLKLRCALKAYIKKSCEPDDRLFSMQSRASGAAFSDHARKRQIPELEEALNNMDESFTEMLLRKIDESGMTDAECYKRANIDRKLFSKIRNDKSYKPAKPTVIAFAIALRLSLKDTIDMLKKAGFALSRSSKFDVIVEYFINSENYDIFEINKVLFAFDQKLLGSF